MALRLCLPRDNRRDASSLRWQFGSIQFINPPLTSKGVQGWPQRGALSMASAGHCRWLPRACHRRQLHHAGWCGPTPAAGTPTVATAHRGHPCHGHRTLWPPPLRSHPPRSPPCTTTSRPPRPPPRHRTPGRPVSPHWGGHPGSAPPKPILFSGSLNGNGGWQWLQLSGSWAAQRVRGTQSKVAFTITKKLKNQHFQTERDTLCI